MAKKTTSFESSMNRLEEIVEQLENGDFPLDESLKLFEEGVKLVKLCNEKIENVEQSIKILINDNGEMKEEDFKPDDE